MSKNIKNIVKGKLKHLFETKGFEAMEVAFGVDHKNDNLDDEEAAQFDSMKTVDDYFTDRKEKGVKLGEPSVQPALNKVRKEDKKDADNYYKEVAKKMLNFQKTDKSEPTQIGEASDKSLNTIKVDREEDQTEPEDVYSTEALGTGMQALKYDNEGTEVYDKFEERMEDLNDGDATYEKLKKYSEKYLKHKYEKPDEYQKPPKLRVTDESHKSYSNVIEENIFKVKNKIKSKSQVIKLVDKLPSRVRVDETIFAVTDGENYYRLIWEGSMDGEAIITHEKNNKIINESINKMKHLWEFKSSDTNSTKKNISEDNKDMFIKMMDKARGKDTLNETVAVNAKANKATINKLAKGLPNDADLGAKCRQLIKQDGNCTQKLKDMAKDNSNDSKLGAACREMCK